MGKYIFTFGLGTTNSKVYQPIEASTQERAREIMHEQYGSNWAFQYTEEEFNESLNQGFFLNLTALPEIHEDTYTPPKPATSEAKIIHITDGDEEVVFAADFAREAIQYYFNVYQDDIVIDEQVEGEGITIRELVGQERTKQFMSYNEAEGKKEKVSFEELAQRYHKPGQVTILQCPVY